MRLTRHSGSYGDAQEESTEYKILPAKEERSDWTAYVNFPEFGTGTEKTSFLRASFQWSDVEKLISAFAQTKHPEAQRWERAIRLAQAVEDLFKNSN